MTALVGLVANASAQDTTTYTYDAKDRLVALSPARSSGTVNTSITFDASDSRILFGIGRLGATPTPSPTPTPTPTTVASAPTLLNPTLDFHSGTTNAIALSTRAQYSSAAVISSFSPPSGGGTASIAGDAQSVTYVAPTLPKPGTCQDPYAVPMS